MSNVPVVGVGVGVVVGIGGMVVVTTEILKLVEFSWED